VKLLRLMIAAFVGVALSVDSRGQDLKVSSHGLDVHYRMLGQGAPVLVIGGGPGDVADRYTTLCELLARNAQCVLIEQRGTGRSTPSAKDASTISVALTLDDFEAVRRQLGLDQWSVLGFSYGGYLASVYAHFFPSSVSSLLLLGSMGLNWESLPQFEDNVTSKLWASDLLLVEYWSDPQRMKADPRQANTEIIRARTPGYFFDRKKSLLVSQPMKSSDFDFEMGDWIFRDILKRGLDLAKMEVSFGGPVLILNGRQDPSGESVPLALSHYYKTSRLVFVEKAGHYSWVEQPEKVLGVIVEFLSANRG
jgi:proline iminopeptidase